MELDLEKAQLMWALARGKSNWGGKYDRTEHFKRFQNLRNIIKDLSKKGWIKIKNKPNYIGISLNSQHKKEIIDFIEKEIPESKGIIS